MSARLADLPLVDPGTRAAWREWLGHNHATSSGIWLVVGKKGNRRTALMYDDAVEEALCFGWIDSTVNRMDADRFRQLFTPRRSNGTWARTNKARVERLIEQGLMMPAGMAVIEAAKRDGSWTLLEDVENLVMPDDLTAALDAEPGAAAGFAGLAVSLQVQALYWIASAKRPETRAKRIAATVNSATESSAPGP